MTPLTGGIAIISKTSIYDTEPDVPEFVDIDVSNTNQGSNTQKQYEIHSWSSGSVILGDYYKYALSMFTTKLDFSN
jgi:Cys-tRNA synthase (O-phospho-L-seryl-tRNA:Cys-tRNA synthase)